MNINQMYLSGDPMLPATPLFPGESEEFTHLIPLAGRPEEIHPQAVAITVIDPEFIFFVDSLQKFSGNRPGDNHVSIGFKNHEMVDGDPAQPGVIISFGLERIDNPGMLAKHPVNPTERIYG